jgi:hypothetical protein
MLFFCLEFAMFVSFVGTRKAFGKLSKIEWAFMTSTHANVHASQSRRLSMMMEGSITIRKAMSTLALLVTWNVWNKHNARVFRNKHAPPMVILEKVKKKARSWVIAGAKHLSEMMLRE